MINPLRPGMERCRSARRAASRSATSFIESLEPRRLLSAGSLDSTFGQSGLISVTDIQHLATDVTASAVAAGGKTVLAGTTILDASGTIGTSQGAVALLDPDGQPDTSFGQAGFVTLAYPGYDTFQATAAIVDSNGNTLVAGTVIGRLSRQVAAFARLLPNGSLDPSFGINGWAALPFGTNGSVNALALGPNGTYFFAGGTGSGVEPGTGDGFAVSRLNADGSIDFSFGRHGYALVQFTRGRLHPQSVSVQAKALTVQSDGKILIVGGGDEPVMARLTSSGSLDPKFGSHGMLGVSSLGGSFDSVVVGSAGEIFAAGGESAGMDAITTSTAALVAAFTARGNPVTTFGNNGILLQFFGAQKRRVSHAGASGIFMTPTGQIVISGSEQLVAGEPRPASPNGPLIERLNPDGSLDAGFGNDGISVFSAPGVDFTVGLVPLDNGDYTVPIEGGLFSSGDLQGRSQLRAVAFTSDGAFDNTFGTAAVGEVDGPTAAGDNAIDSVTATDAGNLFVTESTVDGGSFLAEYDADGQIISSFGTAGRVYFPATQLAYDNGKVFGLSGIGLTGIKLERFNLDGSLDTTFGSGGIVNLGSFAFGDVQEMIPRPDGSVLLQTIAEGDTAANGTAMILYDSSGHQVAMVSRSFDENEVGDVIRQVVSQPDGVTYALISHDAGQLAMTTWTIERFNPDLTPDTSYGTNGAASLDGVPFVSFSGPNITLAPDGSIYFYAPEEFNSASDTLARFTPNGTLDQSFGSGGYTVVPGGELLGSLVQPDGKLVAVTPDDQTKLTLERLNLNGSLDSTFGTDGQSVIDVGISGQVTAGPAAFQSINGNEELLVAGSVGIGTFISDDEAFTGGTVGFAARVHL